MAAPIRIINYLFIVLVFIVMADGVSARPGYSIMDELIDLSAKDTGSIVPPHANTLGAADSFVKMAMISPNPCKDSVEFSFSTLTTEKMHIVITNVRGEIVKEVDAQTNTKVKIRLHVLPGVYSLSAFAESDYLKGEVVVE